MSGKISSVETAIISRLNNCGIADIVGILNKSYSYIPSDMQLPAISVSTIKGQYERLSSTTYNHTIYPTVSIVVRNLRSDKDRRHFGVDLLELVASVLIGQTLGGICEPLDPIDWIDEPAMANLELGDIYYRLSFKTVVEMTITEIIDPSPLLEEIYNTFNIKPENENILTSTVEV